MEVLKEAFRNWSHVGVSEAWPNQREDRSLRSTESTISIYTICHSLSVTEKHFDCHWLEVFLSVLLEMGDFFFSLKVNADITRLENG